MFWSKKCLKNQPHWALPLQVKVVPVQSKESDLEKYVDPAYNLYILPSIRVHYDRMNWKFNILEYLYRPKAKIHTVKKGPTLKPQKSFNGRIPTGQWNSWFR